jgi:electron transfer flavoprotein alpha/beta subunit
VAVVNEFSVNIDSGVVTVHQELDGGTEEIIEVEWPAVFTIQTGLTRPGMPASGGFAGPIPNPWTCCRSLT